jgi:predicted RecB family nuclease
MKANTVGIRLSASDLSNHLACRHLTVLDLAVTTGGRSAPTWHSPDTFVLQQRGMEHETAYLSHLEAAGVVICDLSKIDNDSKALAETVAAMERGVSAIAQATFTDGCWFGRADVLMRVERASRLGSWSYEVYDCKLSRETKAATILQLSMYAELMELVQGILPESMYVVPPSETFQPEQYRVLDYAAYYRHIKARLQMAVRESDSASPTYPEPTPHCDVCRWWRDCDTERRKDDHLSLVAGISRLQRKQLTVWDTTTVAELARFPLPIRERPEYGSKEGYVRARQQARVQVEAREEHRPVHEVLDITEQHGLSLLPAPSNGDVFFDLEGDPFVGLSGREYLFGMVLANSEAEATYECRWALDAANEKKAFQWFVSSVMDRWARDPAMHIYHFAPYEPSALKRLMGRYAVCEDEIDRMLRAKLFIDLHTVLKRSVRASVEQYSLKALEVFHRFTRKIPLEEAGSAMRQMQHGLELGRTADVDDSVKQAIALYNADDCFSTLSLRDWLERIRREQEQAGHNIPRPSASDGVPSRALSDRQLRSAALAEALLADIPADPKMRSDEQTAQWLLANLLDWHRRESKAEWAEYFRLKEFTDEDLLDERAALSGLEFLETIEIVKKIPTDRYRFEKQETSIRGGETVCVRGDNVGKVVAINIGTRTIDIKKMRKTAAVHPRAVFVDATGPDSHELADALHRLGRWVNENGVDSPGPYRAARDLLLRRAPRLLDGTGLGTPDGESVVDASKRLVVQLNNSVLAIQGPPGAGKTFTGARMICELVRQGKKVGITAMTHKVIRNLLDEVIRAAPEFNLSGLRCVQKVKDKPEDDPPGIVLTTDNAEPLAALQNGTQVIAGTSWLWSLESYFEAVDVLFVDEAGQMSLANVLAVSQAAKSLVLLGDPQQLEQPLKGSHPEGADVSALEHLLAGAKTITSDKGIFLERTWRLHPNLCEFTSEAFYEGRLHSHEGLERQGIEGHPWLGEAGLWFVPVEHDGNQNAAPEEVEHIASLVDTLVQPGVMWSDDKGQTRQMQLNDILIVAPYNAQVSDLAARMPDARIGTVDKFQGQQAPVVIYSLTTSAPEDAPRGMEFLYSLNRLNVATSRAQAIVIVVGSPRLLEPECRSPRQMQLANALCRFAELAQTAATVVQAAASE